MDDTSSLAFSRGSPVLASLVWKIIRRNFTGNCGKNTCSCKKHGVECTLACVNRQSVDEVSDIDD